VKMIQYKEVINELTAAVTAVVGMFQCRCGYVSASLWSLLASAASSQLKGPSTEIERS